MYSVITCPKCGLPNIIKNDPKRTECKNCQKSLKFRKLRRFFEGDIEQARAVRAAILAEKRGFKDEFENIQDNDILEERSETSERIEKETLESHDIDFRALKRRQENRKKTSRSDIDTVRDAFENQESPTKKSVIEYAKERGVPEAKAKKVIRRLIEQARVLDLGDSLRLI